MSLRIVDTPPQEASHKRNPGFPLDLDVVDRIRMNRSALERRAATIPHAPHGQKAVAGRMAFEGDHADRPDDTEFR